MFKIGTKLIDAFYLLLSGRNHCQKSIKAFPFSKRYIKKLDDVLLAVTEIYDSGIIFPRGGRKAKRKGTPSINSILLNLAKRIRDYFINCGNVNNNQENFDSFHTRLCNEFLEAINRERKNVGFVPLAYGQAQKMINMTFKYLCCYADYDEFADLFSYSHMPIDAKILHDFNTKYGIKNIRSGINSKGNYYAYYRGVSWTNFDDKLYINLVTDYRNMMAPLKGDHSFLEIEFMMWAGIYVFPSTGIKVKRISSFYLY